MKNYSPSIILIQVYFEPMSKYWRREKESKIKHYAKDCTKPNIAYVVGILGRCKK